MVTASKALETWKLVTRVDMDIAGNPVFGQVLRVIHREAGLAGLGTCRVQASQRLSPIFLQVRCTENIHCNPSRHMHVTPFNSGLTPSHRPVRLPLPNSITCNTSAAVGYLIYDNVLRTRTLGRERGHTQAELFSMRSAKKVWCMACMALEQETQLRTFARSHEIILGRVWTRLGHWRY